ncbi:MAG: hypothetical protein FJX73_03230 [Armatimonadetes bacterium]|nr:hypothetical protein [Armatimonadota bacterium]
MTLREFQDRIEAQYGERDRSRGVDAARAAGRYASGCPKCGSTPCACPPDARMPAASRAATKQLG